MANNRMFLVNKRTKERIIMAKYFPDTGWDCCRENLTDCLDKFFEENQPPPTLRGETDWEIEYEQGGKK